MIAGLICFRIPRIRKKLANTLKVNPIIDQGSLCIRSTMPDKPIPRIAIHMHPLSNEKQKQTLLKNLIFSTQEKALGCKLNIVSSLRIICNAQKTNGYNLVTAVKSR